MALRGRIRRFAEAIRALRRQDGLPPLGEDLGLPRGFTVMRPATGQTVYRVLGRSQPRAWDFYSDRDKGRPRAPTQEFVDFVGISVFGTRTAALVNCARFPKLVAELRLQPGNGFGVARTFADIDEHHSVWGDPESLLDHASGEVLRVDAPGLD